MTSEILLLLESFGEVGGRTLVHGTALALVTWLICATLLRKARPALHAALWTVVLFKFLVPPILPGASPEWLNGKPGQGSIGDRKRPQAVGLACRSGVGRGKCRNGHTGCSHREHQLGGHAAGGLSGSPSARCRDSPGQVPENLRRTEAASPGWFGVDRAGGATDRPPGPAPASLSITRVIPPPPSPG